MIAELVNHLWQSTAFALIAAASTFAFRKNRAQVRYWLWLSASVKFLLPFVLLTSLGSSLWNSLFVEKMATQIAPPSVSLAIIQITQPFPETLSLAPAARHTGFNWIPAAIFAVWMSGFLAVALMRFRGWSRIRAVVRASAPIDVAAQVAVRSSPTLLEPGVVGFYRPTLLLPEGILESLTPPQLEAVLAHELAHVRRRDNLTAAIHMLVEAIFWFYPLVWWIGARLVEERERACDEVVLSLGNQPGIYASAILEVCKIYIESPLTCVSGVSGANLKKRVQAILAGRMAHDLNLKRKTVLAIAGIATLALPIAVGLLNARSVRAQSAAADWEKVAGATLPLTTASVKLAQPDVSGPLCWGTGPLSPLSNDGSGFNGLAFGYRCTVAGYIEFAYKLWLTPRQEQSLISQLPGWALNNRFDIELKGPANVSKDQKRLTIRALLAERFKLAVHFETQEMPVFALVPVASGVTGPRLKPHPYDQICPSLPVSNLPEGIPPLCGIFGGGPGDRRETIGGRDINMAQIANALTQQDSGVDRPTVDETGFTGKYDFTLVFTPTEQPKYSAQYLQQVGGPTFEEALRDQLGLKLEATTGPVDVLVVDHIDWPKLN